MGNPCPAGMVQGSLFGVARLCNFSGGIVSYTAWGIWCLPVLQG